jgi:hypothetical protein
LINKVEQGNKIKHLVKSLKGVCPSISLIATRIVNIVSACSVIGSKEKMQRGKPLAFLYKLSMLFFKDMLFLITSNGELRRNRHDIYAQAYKQTINKQYTKQ